MRGEEDLLAHYYHNFDERVNLHFIGTQDNSFNGILIPEGGWQAFIASEPYQRKKSADRDSYLWTNCSRERLRTRLTAHFSGMVEFLILKVPYLKWRKNHALFGGSSPR
jgi:hypothetical protein